MPDMLHRNTDFPQYDPDESGQTKTTNHKLHHLYVDSTENK